jgi:hypothetical protein
MNNSGKSRTPTSLIIVVLVSIVVLYYLYQFLYSSVNLTPTIIVSDETNTPPTTPPKIPQPYEGGEYSFNTWVYITNFRTNQNVKKPIFELKGNGGAFSTLFVGLGAQTNTLVVRTHTKDPGSVAGNGDTLNIADRADFLRATDASLAGSTLCDLPSVDLQRWVMITVVLSGRTIDVYMDGKLARSCVTPSYFKVDPAGVAPVILGGAGQNMLSGFVAGMSVAAYAMNPGQIYRLYSNGPKSNQTFMSWLVSLFSAKPTA